MNIEGKKVVITGGMGLLGRQWRGSLAKAGATVYTLDIAGDYTADVTSPRQIQDWLSVVSSSLYAGQIPDALICAAAIDAKPGTPGCGRPEDVPLEDFIRTIMVNLVGVQNCIQVFGKAMMKEGHGSIILVSSIFGMVAPDHRRYEGMPGEFWKPAAYSASKAGLLGLARYWGVYLAPFGVRVNAVTFGSMDQEYHPSFREAFTHDVPIGRFAQPGEFDGVLQWLISDASSYMTGANIVVDGGYTAW